MHRRGRGTTRSPPPARRTTSPAAYKREPSRSPMANGHRLAMRGDHDGSTRLSRVLAAVEVARVRGLSRQEPACRRSCARSLGQNHVTGLRAAQAGSRRRRHTPPHQFSTSPRDRAAAAARSETAPRAKTMLERACPRGRRAPSAAWKQLAARARGLLAGRADAGGISAAACRYRGEHLAVRAGPASADRRVAATARRINDARPSSGTHWKTVRPPRAEPWARARAEESAARMRRNRANPAAEPARSPAHRAKTRDRISRPAGLQRRVPTAFLSPRTVASHMYRPTS